MIPPTARHQFMSVLKAEQIGDIPPRFHDPAFCDEVPLYSRYAQVDFLKQYGEVDVLLLELALEYLIKVECAVTANKLKRFIAVTIIRDDVNEYIVPHIFICNSHARKCLKDLHLSPPSKGLGKYVQNLLQKTDHPQDYCVLEDRATVINDVRVFVSYKFRPHGVVSLETFTKSVRF